MKNKIFSAVTALLLYTTFALGQEGVSINNSGAPADASAILDVSSEIKGFLPPRMTTGFRDAISDPATGLMIYNIETNTWDVQIGPSTSKEWASVTLRKSSFLVQFNGSVQQIDPSTTQKVDFNNVVFNDGGDFKTISSEYIVHSDGAGVYHFSTGITLSNLEVSERVTVYIYVNGGPMATNHTSPSGGGQPSEITGTLSVTLKLVSGDKVTVHVAHSGFATKEVYSGADANWFSGHRLY